MNRSLNNRHHAGYYERFLKDYKETIDSVGFARYWLYRFGKEKSHVEIREKTSEQLNDFLELHDGEMIDKDALTEILWLSKDAKLKTINNMIKNVNPNFEIVSKRIRKNGSQFRGWFVKKN